MFQNWSLKRKLLSAFIGLACVILAVGGAGIYTLRQTVTEYNKIAKGAFPNAVDIGGMRSSGIMTRVGVNRLAATYNPDTYKEVVQAIDKFEASYSKSKTEYLSTPFLEGEEKIYHTVEDAWTKYLVVVRELLSLAKTGTAADHDKFVKIFDTSFRSLGNEFYERSSELMSFQSDASERSLSVAEKTASVGTMILVVVVLVGFALAMILAMTLSSGLTLTLKNVATSLDSGAENVAGASKNIADASSELSSSATEQAAALQETVASIDEISAMVNKNAENAKKSQTISTRSHETASRGKETVEAMIRSIDEISQSNSEIMNQTEASNQEISQIIKVIGDIGNKTKVINDIVFQTKLLSFNASVEAARAGEHGKGFAVVAEEVGNLAQMSGNAAKEITQMLDDSIRKVEGIVSNTKTKLDRLVLTGKEKVESGTQTARQCGEVLSEVVTNVSEVNQMIIEISTASQEQSQGVQEITKAMAQLDQVTQQNAAASQQAANSAESLTNEASALRSMVITLMSTIEGGSSDEHVAAQGSLSARPSSVIPFKKRNNSTKPSAQIRPSAAQGRLQTKKLAGGGEIIPSENDPRFEDV